MVSRSRRSPGDFDFPKSSIHCLLLTFERLGYLQRLESSGRFVAGLNLVRIATLASHGITLRQKAGPLLSDLAQRIGLTVHMAVLENNEALLVAKVEPSGTPPVATWVGKRIDYHCTSLGKALIAWMSEDEIQRLVKERHMLRHNENTISTLTRLKEDLMRTRRAGYAVDDEEEETRHTLRGRPCVGRFGQSRSRSERLRHCGPDPAGRPRTHGCGGSGGCLRNVPEPWLVACAGMG